MSRKPVALVTGSSSGIGAAVARRLSDEGMAVVVNAARSADAGRRLAESLPDARFVQADISDEEQVRRLLDEVAGEYGALDLLVNNAGVTRGIPHKDLEAATGEVWRTVLGVNVVGTWQTTVAAMPLLRASGAGHVVNISSVAGVRPAGSSIPYAVSKAAVNHMTRLLAAAVGPEVRVNAIAPGLVDTPWTETFTEIRERVREAVPLRRTGTPEDIAELVVGLHRAAYTTGEVVLADGGAHLLI
ncbi:MULTISPECIES: SDR family NAD(P)-dependent oxidoreductase [Streptomyces]|uniref:SDR family NAD(P)-dependent oxidoreductase n=1 Tax=Streptomyces TaxID=1883 RepID=UPI0004BDA38A|nr:MULTISPECIES: SDR family oxidoreductase [Streptomyces]KOU16023.1 polyketide synthase [Streptomyces sp. WM6349]KOU94319.1 polyketide synthase [Streptomyces sp. XY593]KOV00977.1 polyketide synthase [Streptomyces sp. XY533]KOV02327.1 polyketide synthase [Streptomyces sp. XY511]KOV39583.1 polyketide synthase [Streptomyces sp. H036]